MTVTPASLYADYGTAPVRYNRMPRYVHAFRAVLYTCLLAAVFLHSPVIRAAAIGAIVLALLGGWSGGVRQVLRLGVLALLVCLAPTVGPALGRWLSAHVGFPQSAANPVGIGAFVLGVLIVGSLTGRAISSALKNRPHLNALNHVSGSLVGAGEGVLLVAAFCWVLAAFEIPIQSMRDQLATDAPQRQRWMVSRLVDVQAAIHSDPAGQWLTRNNPLERQPAFQTAQIVAEYVANPRRFSADLDHGGAEDLAALPEVQAYLQAIRDDPRMQTALEQGNVAAVLSSPHLRAMLQDRNLHRVLREHHEGQRRAPAGGTHTQAHRTSRPDYD